MHQITCMSMLCGQYLHWGILIWFLLGPTGPSGISHWSFIMFWSFLWLLGLWWVMERVAGPRSRKRDEPHVQ